MIDYFKYKLDISNLPLHGDIFIEILKWRDVLDDRCRLKYETHLFRWFLYSTHEEDILAFKLKFDCTNKHESL